MTAIFNTQQQKSNTNNSNNRTPTSNYDFNLRHPTYAYLMTAIFNATQQKKKKQYNK